MTARTDYYKVLGVGKSASPGEIKRAYRKLAKQYHPDRNQNDPSAEAKFKNVQEAYRTLSNPEKRAQYDQFGEAGVGRWQTNPRGQQVYQWGGESSINVEDLEDLMSAFGGGGGRGCRASIFDDFFGGRAQPVPRAPQHGNDERRDITLSFEQAIHGCTVSVRLSNKRSGKVETLEVKVPPGVEDGQVIRVQGRGHGGVQGGRAGNLLLAMKIAPHAFFTRHGSDVHVTVPVSVTEAALGAKISVPTIDGRATITIPPGTASETRLRLKGCGVAKSGGSGRGDQYAVIRIVPPPSLSDELRAQFEHFREADSFDPRADCNWAGEK